MMTEQEIEQAQQASGTLCHVCGGTEGIVKALPVLFGGDLADPMNPELPPDLFTCRPCCKLIAVQDWAGLLRRGNPKGAEQ